MNGDNFNRKFSNHRKGHRMKSYKRYNNFLLDQYNILFWEGFLNHLETNIITTLNGVKDGQDSKNCNHRKIIQSQLSSYH